MRQWCVIAGLSLLLADSARVVSAAEQRVPLLKVSEGKLPNDTALEKQSKLTIEDAPIELGGKALKVVFADGDSFGMSRGASERNWSRFGVVEFSAFNPSKQSVKLSFAVRHRGTTSFQTRVDVPVTLKPGRNDVRLSIAEMRNVNGSQPDLSDVMHWYLACHPGQTPTLFFTDFWLVGGNAGPAAQPMRVRTDPARLARIRAAKMPKITQPVMFDTPEADAILSALEVFPADNAFNQLIDEWPLHPNSQAIVASIGADKPFRYNPDMGFVIVPPDQPRVAVNLVEYPSESDAGPYPVPGNTPIEGWPVFYQREGSRSRSQTLADVQRRPEKYEGDRHAIVVDPVNGRLYEFFTFERRSTAGRPGRHRSSTLTSNKLRPDG